MVGCGALAKENKYRLFRLLTCFCQWITSMQWHKLVPPIRLISGWSTKILSNPPCNEEMVSTP
ncbi:hypothetical protein EPI10_020735 [Gossypium australe]|uniref:Uncharacterized protein n=1 Tax=Gossypium australe TaxID=47621 RepID=A0A5B6WGP9_9ROSI|nr:hypothetical protein EPI10_020735 [Gossypium australe]